MPHVVGECLSRLNSCLGRSFRCSLAGSIIVLTFPFKEISTLPFFTDSIVRYFTSDTLIPVAPIVSIIRAGCFPRLFTAPFMSFSYSLRVSSFSLQSHSRRTANPSAGLYHGCIFQQLQVSFHNQDDTYLTILTPIFLDFLHALYLCTRRFPYPVLQGYSWKDHAPKYFL